MPFYTVDWSRYTNYADARGAMDASTTISEIMRLITKIWKYSGCWLGYKPTKKQRWIHLLHRFVLLIFLLCIFCAAGLSFRYLRRLTLDAVTINRVTLSLVYCQCVGCAGSVFYLQLKKRFRGFGKSLNAATMGIGIMRKKQALRRMQYFLLLGFGLPPSIVTLYHIFGNYAPSSKFVIPYHWENFFWNKHLQLLSVAFIFYAAFNWFLAHVLLAEYYSFLFAEISSLNVDVKSDANLYQVAVLKHYALIYHRLTHLNRNLNAAFGFLPTLTTFCNYLIFILHSILFCTRYGSLQMADTIFGLVAMATTSSYITAFIIASLKLRKEGKYFFDAVQDVVTMDWNLDNEYYPVAASNAVYGKPVEFGLAFGRSWTATGRLLVQIFIITVITLLVLLFRMN